MAMAIKADRPDLQRMAFRLEAESDWPPVSVETLWVESLGGEKFRIDNSPFFVKGISVDDIVEGRLEGSDEEEMLYFSRKLKASRHSTIQVIVLVDEIVSDIKSEVAAAGCHIEVSPWPSMFSIDIPERLLVDVIHGLFEQRSSLGQLEYEDACLAPSDHERGDNR